MSDLTQLLRRDLPASIVVFLIAIPLSLGIAAASGAPLLAGLVAAVVGVVRALINDAAPGGSALGDWLGNSGVRFSDPTDEERCCTDNVVRQLANLRTYPTVRDAETAGRLRLTGMYFDLAEARMYEIDPILGDPHPIVVQPAA